MNRREVMQAGAAALWLGTMSGPLSAAERSTARLKILVLGGTNLLGPHVVEALRANGHTLTLFNRGKRAPGLFKDIETLIGDRNGQIDALKGRDWDVVVDNSGYFPAQMRLTTELLRDRVKRYLYVSSISAYADLAAPGIDEGYKLATLKDPNVDKITDETYGGLKAACEQQTEKVFGARATIIRPSYIVGPGDITDRFGYWPVRAARGGDMLVPGNARDLLQFIDARDLAEFMRRCCEQDIGGRYNLCNPPGAVTVGDVLDSTRRISGKSVNPVWASEAFIAKHELVAKGEIPIWAPATGETAGANLVASARAVAQGLRFRSLDTTVRELLAWQSLRPADQQQKMKAGLTAEREKELLQLLRQG